MLVPSEVRVHLGVPRLEGAALLAQPDWLAGWHRLPLQPDPPTQG